MDVSNYKNTCVGIIPIDWDVQRFDNVFELFTTNSFSRDNLTYEKTENEIQNIHYGDIHSKFKNVILDCELEQLPFIKDDLILNQKFNYLEDGDLIIADASEDYDGVGVSVELKNIGSKKIVAGLHTFLARDNSSKTALGFRTYIFNNPKVGIELKKIATGTSVFSISKSELKKLKVPIPSLSEQLKIASILSTWDVAIDNCKAIIENLKNRNIGLAQQLLSGKKRVKGFDKSQWHLKSVEEVAVFKNGKAHENCIDEEGDYFVVNSKFISTQGKVAKASNENLCPLFKNDITMVMSDIPNGKAFAKCFYIPEDNKYTLNQRICALTAKEGTDSKFLYYQINRNNYYLAFNNGVSQTNLKKEEVLECPLLMPDIEEQIQIVKLIDTATEELKQYEQKLQTLQLQKKGLMQQLLTGKTRVKI